jgi:hypothetical protein
LSNKKSREKLETDCYVTSRKWEEEVKEKGEAIAKEDRVKEYAETRSSREPADAVRRMAAKLQTEEGKEIYHQRKKIVGPVFGQVRFNLGLVDFA